jgi:Trypsin
MPPEIGSNPRLHLFSLMASRSGFMRFGLLAPLCALLCMSGAPRAGALVLIGADNSQNLLAPPDGAPWQYIAQVGNGKGTGIYLGGGYVLTANHVTTSLASPYNTVLLDGVTYNLDPNYGTDGSLHLENGSVDLKLLHILGNPGLAPLPLISSTANDLNTACTIIGWGQGKGAAVPNQGWMWGGDTTLARRWGTNTTLGAIITSGSTPELQTSFDFSAGDNEAQLAEADSGSGLFEFLGGQWVLAGVGVDVTTQGEALYDNDLTTSGAQPDRSDFIELKSFASDIERIDGVPEPGSVGLLLCGGLLVAGRRRRGRERKG